MAITNTDIPQLVFNKMSSAKYNELKEAGQLVDNEFYITPDITNIPDIDESTNDKILSNNGSNLIWKDEQVGYKQITNCITEIPQDIKLELNSDGSITLKAGSKVYVPDGKNEDGINKFIEIVVDTDLSRNTFGSSSYKALIIPRYNNGKIDLISYSSLSSALSGTTLPESYTGNFYNTTTNYMNAYEAGNLIDTRAFPIGIMTLTNGVCTSIDQVFNGFGYIGSTIFALPGVKGLSPNGNDSLTGIKKNNIISIENILTYTCPNITANVILDLYANKIAINSQAFDKPTTNLIFFDEINNYNYAGLGISNDIWVGSARIENGKIVLFNPKHPISLIDKNDSSWIAQQVMPSNKYIDLTLGASGSTYTAPANGWFYLAKSSSAANQFIAMEGNIGMRIFATDINANLPISISCQKGGSIKISYNVGGTTNVFRFVYAEGEL